MTFDAYLCLEIYRAKGNFHASQPVSLSTSVGSTSSFTVILKEGREVIDAELLTLADSGRIRVGTCTLRSERPAGVLI